MKRFVLDTNVLLADPSALYAFEEHSIVVPVVVLEELDTFKTAKGDLGHNARKVIREMDKLIGENTYTRDIKVNEKGGTLTVLAESPHSLIR